jgi:short-subunit dehydrogenase
MASSGPLRGAIVVVTGASSGLGREVAVQFARRGARLVLAARRREALEQTARMCRSAGGEATVVVTDVTSESQVQHLAETALAQWGRIDVWINNAGVTLFGRLADAPFDEHRRVLETNVHGAIFGARAVIPTFRRQRRGVLINVGSVLSKVGQPFVPSYVISKFALRGLTEALRVELADEPGVHVCTVMPYAMNTPHFESGANEVGLEARAMPPAQSPERVARAIVKLAERPRRELHVPRVAVLGYALHALWPRTTERLLLHALREWHFADDAQRQTTGNLYRPAQQQARVHGTRPPRIGLSGFLGWTLRELLKIEADTIRRGFLLLRKNRGAPASAAPAGP